MFFLGKDKKLICDDLTIRPYTLKTLRSLCDLYIINKGLGDKNAYLDYLVDRLLMILLSPYAIFALK